MSYVIYSDHGAHHMEIPVGLPDEEGARLELKELALAAASLGIDRLHRLFGPSGFITAYSTFGGVVREHPDASFPKEHW